MAAEMPAKRVRHGGMRALIAADVDLVALTGPDGDPDRLVTSSRCTLRKFQAKVVVGRIETVRGWMWVKRYNVWSLRVALASLGRRSPAEAAFMNTRALAARGFAVPRPLAAVEYRRVGVLRRSFFLTDEVPHAETADVAWRRILALTDGPTRRHRRQSSRSVIPFRRSISQERGAVAPNPDRISASYWSIRDSSLTPSGTISLVDAGSIRQGSVQALAG